MAKKKIRVLPRTDKILQQVGEQIKLSRLRRGISATLAAERADISRSTLWKVEKGDAYCIYRYLCCCSSCH